LPSRSAIGLGLPVRTVIERGHTGQAPERQSGCPVAAGLEGPWPGQQPAAQGLPCERRAGKLGIETIAGRIQFAL